jgi:hypothetical protein
MCFLLLLSSELFFDGSLKVFLVVRLSSNEIGSRGFEILPDLLG